MFVQEEATAALAMGFIGIEDESGLKTYPGSRGADDDWKASDGCESTMAAKYNTCKSGLHCAVYALILKAPRILNKCTTHHFLMLFEDMDEQPSF